MYDLSNMSPEDAAFFREKGYPRQTPEFEARMNAWARKLNAELAPHRALIDQRKDEWLDNWNKLFARDHDAIGRVLKHHLILEHYVTRYLEAVAPNHNWKRARLRFAQKIELIPKGDIIIDSLVLGIREVNAVRNALGHQIDARPALGTLEQCVRTLGHMHPYWQKTYSDAIAVIEDFTELVCSSLPIDADVAQIYKDAHERVGPMK